MLRFLSRTLICNNGAAQFLWSDLAAAPLAHFSNEQSGTSGADAK